MRPTTAHSQACYSLIGRRWPSPPASTQQGRTHIHQSQALFYRLPRAVLARNNASGHSDRLLGRGTSSSTRQRVDSIAAPSPLPAIPSRVLRGEQTVSQGLASHLERASQLESPALAAGWVSACVAGHREPIPPPHTHTPHTSQHPAAPGRLSPAQQRRSGCTLVHCYCYMEARKRHLPPRGYMKDFVLARQAPPCTVPHTAACSWPSAVGQTPSCSSLHLLYTGKCSP